MQLVHGLKLHDGASLCASLTLEGLLSLCQCLCHVEGVPMFSGSNDALSKFGKKLVAATQAYSTLSNYCAFVLHAWPGIQCGLDKLYM